MSMNAAMIGKECLPNDGDPGRIRTPDLTIRSRLLYPAELRGLTVKPFQMLICFYRISSHQTLTRAGSLVSPGTNAAVLEIICVGFLDYWALLRFFNNVWQAVAFSISNCVLFGIKP